MTRSDPAELLDLDPKVERSAYWAVKDSNMDLAQVGEQRKLQLQELVELRLDSYENAKLYKEKSKAAHDKMILKREFQEGERVLLYSSRLKLMPGKLRSQWVGPYTIVRVFSYGAMEITQEDTGRSFKVNRQRLKHFHGGFPNHAVDVIQLHDPIIL